LRWSKQPIGSIFAKGEAEQREARQQLDIDDVIPKQVFAARIG